MLIADAVIAVANRGLTTQGPHRIARPCKHSDGQGFNDMIPIMPAVETCETISAHDPDEVGFGHGLFECGQSLRRVVAVDLVFEIGDFEARVVGDEFGVGEAGRIFTGFFGVFQGVLWRDQPPYPIELETL